MLIKNTDSVDTKDTLAVVRGVGGRKNGWKDQRGVKTST